MATTSSTDWLDALRAEVRRTSQQAAGDRLGISGSVVSAVLSGTYGASTAAIERRVRGHLLHEQLMCPVLGPVLVHVCLRVQMRNPAKPGGNPFHAAARQCCTGLGRYAAQGRCPQYCGPGRKATDAEDTDA